MFRIDYQSYSSPFDCDEIEPVTLVCLWILNLGANIGIGYGITKATGNPLISLGVCAITFSFGCALSAGLAHLSKDDNICCWPIYAVELCASGLENCCSTLFKRSSYQRVNSEDKIESPSVSVV